MPGRNLTRIEAEARAALLDVHSYDIDLDLTDPGGTFRSVSRVSFACRQPGAETFLDLIAPAVRRVELNGRSVDPVAVFSDSRVRLAGLAEENVAVVEADAEWSHTGEGLHRFTDPVDGRTYCYSQCEVADARRILANFEQPDLKARFTFHVTAPAGWTVWSNQPVDHVEPAAPRGDSGDTAGPVGGIGDAGGGFFEPVGGAEQAEHVNSASPVELGDDTAVRVWHFAETPPMSTYLAAVVAGPYTAWQDVHRSTDGRDIPLSVLVRPSMAAHLDVADIFAVTKTGFEFYERSFGLPYPYAKYDQAFVPEFNAGAMENIGLVTHTETYVFRSKPTQARVDRRAVTILHEQAHMWFGDLVTMRWWNDLWLNESFAEFVSHLAAAQTSWPEAWTTFLGSEKGWALSQDQLPSTHPIVAPIRDLAEVQVNFDGITYAKGAAVLRQLVAWVGQETFLRGVGVYLRKHAFGNATLADLLVELEEASGRSLAEWSRQWLEEAGVTTLRPVLVPQPTSPSRGRGLVGRLTIAQEIPPVYAASAVDSGLPEVVPSLRPHRVAVAGYDFAPGGPRTELTRTWVAETAGRTVLPPVAAGRTELTRTWVAETGVAGATTVVTQAEGLPRPALLLVNDGDLAYAKLRFDPDSLAVARHHVGALSDSLARALVHAALWDATRDAELPAFDYLESTLAAIPSETNSTTLATLLSQVRTALTFYVAPGRRSQLTADVAGRLGSLAMSAAPGGDSQLQFFTSFAALAHDPASLDALARVWRGEASPPGLELDADLRWEILTALVAGGRLGESDIAAELRRDPTTRGRELAAGARASVPTPQAKQAAWTLIVDDPTTTNATQRALIAGFVKVADRSLLTGFVEPYFAVLEDIWASRGLETASNVVEGLYPSLSLNHVDVVGATDAWLAQLGDRWPALRRLVVEGRATVVRALQAQTTDARAGSVDPVARRP